MAAADVPRPRPLLTRHACIHRAGTLFTKRRSFKVFRVRTDTGHKAPYAQCLKLKSVALVPVRCDPVWCEKLPSAGSKVVYSPNLRRGYCSDFGWSGTARLQLCSLVSTAGRCVTTIYIIMGRGCAHDRLLHVVLSGQLTLPQARQVQDPCGACCCCCCGCCCGCGCAAPVGSPPGRGCEQPCLLQVVRNGQLMLVQLGHIHDPAGASLASAARCIA